MATWKKASKVMMLVVFPGVWFVLLALVSASYVTPLTMSKSLHNLHAIKFYRGAIQYWKGVHYEIVPGDGPGGVVERMPGWAVNSPDARQFWPNVARPDPSDNHIAVHTWPPFRRQGRMMFGRSETVAYAPDGPDRGIIYQLQQGYDMTARAMSGWHLLALLSIGLIPVIRYVFAPPSTPGHCVRCGYDLRGSSSRCPECGAINDGLPPPEATAEA